MNSRRIEFEQLDWIQAQTGLRYKESLGEHHKLRLAEFSEGFVEGDWCTKGHMGYVVEGSAQIDFNGEHVLYAAGDALSIEEGAAQKHKVVMAPGGRVVFFLVENL